MVLRAVCSVLKMAGREGPCIMTTMLSAKLLLLDLVQ